MLKGKTIVLGVTGSIAAYKMANVASMLVKRGCEVHVVMTKNATNFINPIAFESLTNTKCLVETFDRNFQFHVAHVSLTDKADAMLIAPASANIIGKIANGIADDMLSTTVMACNKPVIISPAMNTKMYNLSLIHICRHADRRKHGHGKPPRKKKRSKLGNHQERKRNVPREIKNVRFRTRRPHDIQSRIIIRRSETGINITNGNAEETKSAVTRRTHSSTRSENCKESIRYYRKDRSKR